MNLYDLGRHLQVVDQDPRLSGLSVRFIRVLLMVDASPGCSTRWLAGQCQCSVAAAHRAVIELQRRGVVVNKVNPVNRTLRQVHLSTAGENLIAELRDTA